MKYSLYSLTILFALLSSCSLLSQQEDTQYKIKKIESLKQISIEENQINIGVISTGCTKKEDFIIRSLQSEQVCDVTIYRIKPDFCRRAPQIVDIQLDWNKTEKCGEQDVKVLNPFSTTTGATTGAK